MPKISTYAASAVSQTLAYGEVASSEVAKYLMSPMFGLLCTKLLQKLMPITSEYQPSRESGHLYSNLLGDICKQRREIYLHEPLANFTHIYWEIIGKQRGEIYLHEHLANYTQIYWEIIGKQRREFYLHEHLANFTQIFFK